MRYAESHEQRQVVDRLHRDPRFRLIPWFGAPMSARRTPAQIAVAKMLGMRAGVPDLLFLAPSPKSAHIGLALEFKSPTWKGRISAEQDIFAEMLRRSGWRVEYPRIKEEAWAYICDHFGFEPYWP